MCGRGGEVRVAVKRAWMPIQARTRVENRTVPSVATLRVVAACQSPARFFVQIWTACPASRGSVVARYVTDAPAGTTTLAEVKAPALVVTPGRSRPI